MRILGELFDGKSKLPEQDTEAMPPPTNLENDPNLVRVFDKYGQELFITKEHWRTIVLPDAIQSQWNNPDQLYGTIVTALQDGLISDVQSAAEQLHRIDPIASRGACLYGIVLMENGRLDEAEQVLRSFLQKHGDDGVVLTNLAKVFSLRNNMQAAEETLWHALEVDPNQENGLGWYEAIQRERSGEDAGLDALRRIAALSGSWRAQLWLARAALKSHDLNQALNHYRESLSRAGKDVPFDVLMQISGDLGNHGYLPELLAIVEPYFIPEQHGLQVGNNLIKAHFDLGNHDAARRILDQLYSLKRPDWRDTLSYWDTAIAKGRLETSKVDPKVPLTVVMLSIEGPVWLKPSSPATGLFPSNDQGATVISFLGSSATTATKSQDIEQQISDGPGRLSRALPLFLAEQVKFSCQANVQTLVPWVAQNSGGFVLAGVAWSDDDTVTYAKQNDIKCAYVVITHLKTQAEPWSVELRLLQTSDGKCVGSLESSFPSSNPGEQIRELAPSLVNLLGELAEIKPSAPALLYQLPNSANLTDYLLRLEQLLAVRCAAVGDVSQSFLNGEREIIFGNLQLCLACPDNVPTRILLAQTLLTMNKVRPDIVREFVEKISLLQKEHPLKEPAQTVVQDMLSEVSVVTN